MKITNSEYDIIIRSINTLISYGKELESYHREAEVLKAKLEKEYDDIAERNMSEGMTTDEEEIYPSRLHTEYGGSPNGDKKVE
jgi:hypothetical protein|tara:strand:- start:2567 stop:2815 length:249 start_codon:yes stop_codon:yes gene_type:complete